MRQGRKRQTSAAAAAVACSIGRDMLRSDRLSGGRLSACQAGSAWQAGCGWHRGWQAGWQAAGMNVRQEHAASGCLRLSGARQAGRQAGWEGIAVIVVVVV